jgi:hypothetical protein
LRTHQEELATLTQQHEASNLSTRRQHEAAVRDAVTARAVAQRALEASRREREEVMAVTRPNP